MLHTVLPQQSRAVLHIGDVLWLLHNMLPCTASQFPSTAVFQASLLGLMDAVYWSSSQTMPAPQLIFFEEILFYNRLSKKLEKNSRNSHCA